MRTDCLGTGISLEVTFANIIMCHHESNRLDSCLSGASGLVTLICFQIILTVSSPVDLPVTCHPSPSLITFALG